MLIFLVGYMGCGKSTIGRKLSKKLSMPLFDMDKVIEEREGMPVVEIFAQKGEQEFREMERELLSELIEQGESAIISTGGGLPLWFDNMERMNGAGTAVYLSRSVDNIISRMSQRGRDKRPRIRGLNDEELKEFMESDLSTRLPFYNKASFVIDAESLADKKIVKLIIKKAGLA
ncbi:MAG: shikimate kinase [Rikenellaceae bacterium]